MKYAIDPDWWAHRVKEMEKAIQADPDMPPFMVHYVEGEFELNDGNHRHQACENLGVENVWVIIWITEKEEMEDFLARYGEYVKDCRVIRR
ncbi:MAG: ParB N-terminal domain-containing protein [Clostridia bacterium]|nr:ParB N-terminal domain-containing protein [Clostridia bacterium]